jgi:uracil DNA glycosylase
MKKENLNQEILVDYLKNAENNAENIKIVLIGQDPYPSDANGIPFCKNDLKNIKNTSGGFILKRLGILSFDSNDGIATFHHLLEKGILFLNLSNQLLKTEDGKWLNRELIDELLIDSFKSNENIISKLNPSVLILRLGSQKKLSGFFKSNYYKPNKDKYKILSIIHPSPFNKNRESWRNIWGKDEINSIEEFTKFFELKIT